MLVGDNSNKGGETAGTNKRMSPWGSRRVSAEAFTRMLRAPQHDIRAVIACRLSIKPGLITSFKPAICC